MLHTQKKLSRTLAASMLLVMLAVFMFPSQAAASTPASPSSISFTNERDGGSSKPKLWVTNTVIPIKDDDGTLYDLPADLDTEFTYQIKKVDMATMGGFPASAIPMEMTYIHMDQDGKETSKTTKDSGCFTLRSGETAIFPEVGLSSKYVIVEQPKDRFLQVTPSGGTAASAVIDQGGASVEFVNVYLPEKATEQSRIFFSDTIIWPDGYEIPKVPKFAFDFQTDGVQYNGTPGCETTDYALSWSSVGENPVNVYADSSTKRAGISLDSGRFWLTGNHLAVFEMPSGLSTYDISLHTGADAYAPPKESIEGWTKTSETNVSGALTDGSQILAKMSFTAYPFAVSCRLEDYSGGAAFTYILTKTRDEEPAAGQEYYLYGPDKRLLQDTPLKTAEDGTFKLAPNQTAVFVNNSNRDIFSIKQKPQAGYKQTFPEGNDYYMQQVISADEVLVLPFVNAPAEGSGILALSKTVKSPLSEDYDKTFLFEITLGSNLGGTYGDAEFKAGVARLEMKDGDVKYIPLPTGTAYEVKEILVTSWGHFKVIPENEKGTVAEKTTTDVSFINETGLPNSGGPGLAGLFTILLVSLLTGICLILLARRRGAAASRK